MTVSSVHAVRTTKGNSVFALSLYAWTSLIKYSNGEHITD